MYLLHSSALLAVLLALAPSGARAQRTVAASLRTGLATDMCVEVPRGSREAGQRVALAACHAGPAQRFAIVEDGEIRVYGDMCLDAIGGRGADGDPIGIWPCNGGRNQRWSLTPSGEIRGIEGRCIDVKDGAAWNGAELVLRDCNGGPSQKWYSVRHRAGSPPHTDIL